jgi:hypothetical protein
VKSLEKTTEIKEELITIKRELMLNKLCIDRLNSKKEIISKKIWINHLNNNNKLLIKKNIKMEKLKKFLNNKHFMLINLNLKMLKKIKIKNQIFLICIEIDVCIYFLCNFFSISTQIHETSLYFTF